MRIRAVFMRVIKELIRDKRTLALMLLAPILVLTLMYLIFDTNADKDLKLGYSDSVPNEIITALPEGKVHASLIKGKDIQNNIDSNKLDAYVEKDGNRLKVTYENEDPSKSSAVKQVLGSAMQQAKMKDMKHQMSLVMQKLPKKPEMNKEEKLEIEHKYLYGDEDSSYFDRMFPILIGFFVFFFVFLISGIALLRERTNGTLERLLATPIQRSEIVFGYLVGFGLFAVLQTLLIVSYAVFLLKIDVVGNIGWVILINILVALAALSIGIFVSTFAHSEFQMMQFIPLVVIPQIFFSGIIPLDSIATWISSIGYLFPLRYAGNALTNVMIKGQGFEHIWFDLLVLCGFILVFTVLNIIGLKRYRKV